MRSKTSMRVRVVTIASVALGLLATSACTNVAGLTGYEFVDGGGGGGDGGSGDGAFDDAPRPMGDGAVGDGGMCAATLTGFAAACASCGQAKCCNQAVVCTAVPLCISRAKANNCSGGDAACRSLTDCLRTNCMCGG